MPWPSGSHVYAAVSPCVSGGATPSSLLVPGSGPVKSVREQRAPLASRGDLA